MTDQQKRQFLGKVNQQSGVFHNGLATECWLWEGYIDKLGYGIYQTDWAKEITTKAYRLSYILFTDPMLRDPKQVVRHDCDNPTCVNPAHLRLGSHADNVADMDERGRRVVLRGHAHGSSKLSPEQVAEIRRLSADGMMGKDIATRFGLNKNTIYKLLNGVTYQ